MVETAVRPKDAPTASGEAPKPVFHQSAESILGKAQAQPVTAGLPRIQKKPPTAEDKDDDHVETGNAVTHTPYRGRGRFRGGNRGRRQRQRWVTQSDEAPSEGNNTESSPRAVLNLMTPNRSGEAKPTVSLLGAKAVMQQKLSAMYPGMRGLEAAHAAFAMCQVNINVDVEDVAAGPSNPAQRGKRAFKGKSWGQVGSETRSRKPR